MISMIIFENKEATITKLNKRIAWSNFTKLDVSPISNSTSYSKAFGRKRFNMKTEKEKPD